MTSPTQTDVLCVVDNSGSMPNNQENLANDIPILSVTCGTQTLVRGDLTRGWAYDSVKNEVVFGSAIEWTVQPRGTNFVIAFTPAVNL